MKILLIGDILKNNGPANVNKEIIKNSNNRIIYLKSNNKFLKIIEFIYKLLTSKVIIISGYSDNNLKISKLVKKFHKKIIYIMHGCIKFENEINKLGLEPKKVNDEIKFIKNVDLVLCVSENYSKWVKNYYNINNNISFLNNGIINDIKKKRRDRNKKNNNEYAITLIGGNRNIKNNKIVCDVIDEMIDEGHKISVNLFGLEYPNNEEISSKNIKQFGKVDYDVLCNYLNESDLYISNSIVEPFNLSVFDALINGCDILLSNNVGALSVINTEQNDIIYDCMDKSEIKEKILYSMKHSNNLRIVNSISEDSSWNSSVIKLISICDNIAKKR